MRILRPPPSPDEAPMLALRIIAVLLIIASTWALAEGGFSYTKDSKDVKLGPIELAVKEKENVAVPKWAAFAGIGVGVVLLVLRKPKG
jgi:hypothetical protein